MRVSLKLAGGMGAVRQAVMAGDAARIVDTPATAIAAPVVATGEVAAATAAVAITLGATDMVTDMVTVMGIVAAAWTAVAGPIFRRVATATGVITGIAMDMHTVERTADTLIHTRITGRPATDTVIG